MQTNKCDQLGPLTEYHPRLVAWSNMYCKHYYWKWNHTFRFVELKSTSQFFNFLLFIFLCQIKHAINSLCLNISPDVRLFTIWAESFLWIVYAKFLSRFLTTFCKHCVRSVFKKSSYGSGGPQASHVSKTDRSCIDFHTFLPCHRIFELLAWQSHSLYIEYT